MTNSKVHGHKVGITSLGVSGRMKDLQPADERQRLAVVYVLVDSYCGDGFVWAPEEAKQDPLHQVWRWLHGPKRPAALRDRNVHRMHPRLCAGALDGGGRASDVVRVCVSEDDVAEILRTAAQRAQRIEDRGLVIRKAGIDQHEFAVISFEQNTVDVPEKGALVCPLSRVPSGLP
jgi:hypothetical protein